MTRKEALAEAQRRWGPDAQVDYWKEFWQGSGSPMVVRYVFEGRIGPCNGRGLTWEAAFADADRREGKSA